MAFEKSPLITATLLGLVTALVAALSQAPVVPASVPPGAPAPPATTRADASRSPGKITEQAPSDAMRLVLAFFACDRDRLADALAGCPLDIVVATLPDPLASQLDWAFDQHLNALRRAHEAAGFVVDGFRLPWPDGGRADDGADAAEQPGVMLFRHASARKLRLLFLVGEVPTAGIHKRAFAAALRDRDELLALAPRAAGKAPPLRVVGPAFSGSAASLRRSLDAWLDAQPGRSAEVVTGSATSSTNVETLTRSEPNGAQIRFGATVHTDETLLACLHDDVLPALRLHRSQVAILQESSTTYGAAVRTEIVQQTERESDPATVGAGRYLLLPFPLNVSGLRAAYARAWSRSGAGARPMFELDLESRDHHGELPRPLSKLSPAVTDLMLAELCRVLAEQRIRLVVLFATDVRDKVFLGREIAERLPDVQLVTTEGNLLHARSELADAQRGMLVLSTYPMFAPPGAWQPSSVDADQRLLFATDGAQGVYNATLVQLGLPSAVVDYAPPIARAGPVSQPPVWLTCVGRTRMLPVAVHAPRCATERYPLELDLGDREVVVLRRPMSLAALLLTVTLGFSILCIGLRLLSGVDGRARRRLLKAIGTTNRARPDADFAELLQVAYTLHAEIYRAIQMTVLTGLFLPHGALLWLVAGIGTGAAAANAAHLCWAMVLIVLGVAAAAVGWVRVLRIALPFARRGWSFMPAAGPAARIPWRAEIVLRTSIAVIGVLCFAAWVVYSWSAVGLGRELRHAEPFLQRVTLLDEGVSPLLPLFLIGLGMVLWCAWHRRRARLLQEEVPFEAGEAPPAVMFGTERSAAAVRLSLTHAVPDGRGFVLGLGLLVIAVWLLTQCDRTLERLVLDSEWMGRAFDTLFFPGLIGLLLATAWAAYRLFVVWRRAEALLDVHAEPRVIAACRRVVEGHGVSIDLGLWLPVTRSDLQPAVARAWRRLARAGAALGDPALAPLQQLLPVDASPMSHTRAHVVATLRELTPPLELLDDAVLDAPAPASPESLRRTWLECAHDVLALELLGWLRWTTCHVRTLAIFLVLSLLLATALLWSYPFHPQQLLRGAFLVVSAAVVIALTMVITAMNRNTIASVLSKASQPGQVTWDRSFVMNVLTFSLLPILTAVSAQMPTFVTPLFGWLEPAMKSLTQSG